MNDVPQREREPELKECLMALENLSSRFDGLTLDMRNKIQTIYNPPQVEPMNKSLDNEKLSEPADYVGKMNVQIDKLKVYANRLEDLLYKFNKII